SLRATRVDMADNAQACIGRQHALNALCHHVGSVRNCDLSGMKRVSNSYTAAVVNRYPGSAGCSVEHGVEQRPIRHGIASVFHAFGFTIGRSHGSAIKVIATDHNRRFDFSLLHKVVHRETELRTLTIAKPADSSRKALELDAPFRTIDPAL